MRPVHDIRTGYTKIEPNINLKQNMRIGELAAQTGLTTSAIRFYEKKGLMRPPARGSGGYRHYTDAALRQLRRIQLGQTMGLSLEAMRRLFVDDDEGYAERTLKQVEARLLEVAALQAVLAGQQRALLSARATLAGAVTDERPLQCELARRA